MGTGTFVGTGFFFGAVTLTVITAFFLLFAFEVTVILAVPDFFAVTLPLFVTGQSKVRSANKQVDFFCFKGNLPAGNYFSYG